MRRLPVYFLIDVSESMVGEPISQVSKGLQTILQELRCDPYALETVYVSIIAFAGKTQTLVPLTELVKFSPPTDFPIGSGTSLGNAMEFLMYTISLETTKTTAEIKGDWKPIIFLFTDGTPTDDTKHTFHKWNSEYRKLCNLIIVTIGNNVDTHLLGGITDNVLVLNNNGDNSFKSFFKWVTASIRAYSMSVAEVGNVAFNLPSVEGSDLKMADTSIPCKIDEHYFILQGRCQKNKKLYLIKSSKSTNQKGNVFDFIGAYAIDEKLYLSLSDGSKISSNTESVKINGGSECPYCGNIISRLKCSCGHIMCYSPEADNICPWCGEKIESIIPVNSINVRREKG